MVATVLGSTIVEGCMVIVMVTMVVGVLVIVMGILVEMVFIDFGSDGRVATCTTATRRCNTTVV